MQNSALMERRVRGNLLARCGVGEKLEMISKTYVVSYVYDKDGRMTQITNARGFKTAYAYDKVGNLVKVTNAMDGVAAYVYDKNGNLLSETNTDGGVTRYTYDKLNRVTSITDPEGAVTRVEYDANGNITKVVQADGKSITYSYDARNQLVSYVDPEGYTFSFTYDGNGNITSSTDGNGNTTRYTYDGLDRITQRTDEEGGVATQTFDADGRLIKTVDEEGAETSYAYDACGRVVKMTDALGNSTTYTYDEMDRLLTATDAKGGVTAYTYTDRGDVATVTDAEGYVTSYEYDGNQNLVKLTTPDGVTTYEYDPLDRLIKTTTPDGKSEHITYNGEGDVTSKTDKAGHKTSYVLDANGRIVETIDALGNSTLFEYDPMGRLTKTSLHRVDAQDKADEWEITLYEYDGRGLVTKETNALGAVTAYAYDGNGNLVSKKDADGYETKYTYNALDFVTQINYNGGKQASYRYNKVGELVEMEDWTGTTSFEVDLLRRITQVTDRKGNVVEYGYDEVGNQTSIDYPDGTGVDYAYDLLGQLKTVTEDDGRATAYSYDGMGRVVRMEYPHGWVEDYVYDSIGQLLRVDDTDPTRKDMKQQKHVYKYDDCGNMVYEYMRGNGTGEATTENTYTYDALHRLTRADEVYGKAWREYQYDSLGNLTYESNSNNVHYDYKLNNLNQITQKTYSSNDKEGTLYTYDNRGNLVLEQYGKLNGNGNNNGNGQRTTVGQYTYDETNKMVLGVNSSGESSAYLYNGLGALVEDTWKIAKNGYGYHDVDAGLGDADPNNGRGGGGSNGQGNGNGNGQGNGNGSGDKPTGSLVTSFSTVVKQFVVDYTSPTFEPLMEHEVNGLDYRYVYGNDRLSVNITGVETSSGNLVENGNQIRLYYHMDYLGTTDYLTSPVSLKVTSWTHYNEWGEITHNAVLKSGKRELDLVKRFATHDYDAVLGMYYAKARFYDAENRRFASVDPILDASEYNIKAYIESPVQLVPYLYVMDNPLIYADPLGMAAMIAYGGTLYYAAASTAAFPPAGVAVFVVGVGVCIISGVYAYYSPTRAWDDNFARAEALEQAKYFADYPVPPYSGPFDINPDEFGVSAPQGKPNSAATTGAEAAIAGYNAYLSCNKKKVKPGKGAVSAAGQVSSGGPHNDDDDDDHMIGQNGTKTNGSKTTGKNGKVERVDVENMAPGQRPGDVHYHSETGQKWRYDIKIQKLVDPDSGALAPPAVQRVLNNSWFQKAIKKALEILGE